jgi:hypothetical protein
MTKRKKVAALLDAEGGFDREGGAAVTFTYDCGDPCLAQLREEYGLAAVAGEGNTQERAVNLLHWLCARGRHSNDFSVDKQNALRLLEYVSDAAHGLNCKLLSVTLSEMCLSVGIKARVLWLLPRDPEDPDCHAVVMAYLPERGKWMFLDPTSDVYFADAGGNALSPMEIRDALARGGELTINPGAVGKNKSLLKWYLDYLAKDMFRFECIRDTRFGMLDHARVHIHLCPARFDLAAWEAKKFSGQPGQAEYIFASPESFWAGD